MAASAPASVAGASTSGAPRCSSTRILSLLGAALEKADVVSKPLESTRGIRLQHRTAATRRLEARVALKGKHKSRSACANRNKIGAGARPRCPSDPAKAERPPRGQRACVQRTSRCSSVLPLTSLPPAVTHV